MSGKALRLFLMTAPLLAGCAVFPHKPVSAATPQVKEVAVATTRPSAVASQTTTRRAKAPARTAPPKPRPTPASQVSPAASAKALRPTIIVKPGVRPEQPVPLFRQAIVLANVRSAVADLPAPPQAEFRQGLLTLKFREATPGQVSAAVNRVMALPDVARVQVVPAP